jgi:hypothetical protein
VLLTQDIMQETSTLLLRRQLGGERLAEFMQIFRLMCSSPYQDFGNRADVFGQTVFDSLEHARIPGRRRSCVPRLCRGVFISSGMVCRREDLG